MYPRVQYVSMIMKQKGLAPWLLDLIVRQRGAGVPVGEGREN
jgi:hypothetical protein